ncbi:MAG: hypothetical protein VXV87_04985, partial [Pseudomonadota bacterium]|nr:hypothetical protein [Pseudomonadota bacterium]
MLEHALFLGLLIGACFGLGVAVLALRLRARDTQDTAPDTDPMMEKITETVAQMARAQSELTGRLDGMAAAQGHGRAQRNLGDMHCHAEGGSKDLIEAARLYTLA